MHSLGASQGSDGIGQHPIHGVFGCHVSSPAVRVGSILIPYLINIGSKQKRDGVKAPPFRIVSVPVFGELLQCDVPAALLIALLVSQRLAVEKALPPDRRYRSDGGFDGVAVT
ncbi:hypothetical protein [Bradyrhizobium sp. dw_411]|uniref:hypothetical protein n=1 Tax=Bradyrhizobium sp. dw_411 TaxID=2720082 RepID=UPI001BCDFFC4|nr:hypothetical protein [Bradyrhizobium sp. dw_411]